MGVYSPGGSSNTSANVGNSNPVSTPKNTQVTIASANTEETIALDANVIRFRIRAQGQAKLQLAYAVGESGTNYWTIMPGNIYTEDNIDNSSGLTIYIQSNKASTTVEIVSWT